jgi:hypothetical protein
MNSPLARENGIPLKIADFKKTLESNTGSPVPAELAAYRLISIEPLVVSIELGVECWR